jgi:hypothetical protein
MEVEEGLLTCFDDGSSDGGGGFHRLPAVEAKKPWISSIDVRSILLQASELRKADKTVDLTTRSTFASTDLM